MAPRRKNTTLNRDKGYTETLHFVRTPHAPARHHVVLLDGTWNDENGTSFVDPWTGESRTVVTNLVKLDRALAPDSATQIVHYHRGIGNDETNTRIQQLFTGAFGADEQCIRAGAYAQLAIDYQPGDLLSIFGFSRGAATARMLANDLHRLGVPDQLQVTRREWNGEYRIVGCRAPKSATKTPVDVAFLGLWDTVGSFGWPLDLGPLPFNRINFNKPLDLAPNVKHAVHCLALDEDRKAFAPVLLDGPEDVVEEVWFPGVHSDVGGGYGMDALGRITMGFMLDRWQRALTAAGAPALLWQEDRRRAVIPGPGDRIVRHWHPGATALKRPRVVTGLRGAPPRLHRSVSELVAHGATLKVRSDEQSPYETRNYNPPNLPLVATEV